MGHTVEYQCKCGYDKEVSLGEGIFSNRESYIRQVFGEEELIEFDEAKKDGTLSEFSLEYRLAECLNCAELISMPILYYRSGTQTQEIKKECFVCGGTVTPLNQESVSCPKCGGHLTSKEVGYWD